MPLRAILDDKEIISINFTKEEWISLKNKIKKGSSSLILPCCKQKGFLRTSSKGLNHFVHSKNDLNCDWKPETPQHLKSKVEIIKACNKNGWQAIPEFSQNDWRADVLAIKSNSRIAFEVQWSKQKEEDTKFRQEKYRRDNVRGCWFFRTIPKELKSFNEKPLANKDLPLFKIHEDENEEIIVIFGDIKKSLYEFVDDLLSKKIKFCKQYRLLPEQNIEITFYEKTCWKCGKEQHSYIINKEFKTCCKNDYNYYRENEIYYHPKIIEFIEEILQSNEGKDIKFGGWFQCYYCNAEFGAHYLIGEKMDAKYQDNNITFKKNIEIGEIIIDNSNHWCYSENKDFCE